MTRRQLVAATLAVLAGSAPSAQRPARFTYERPIQIMTPGAQRLDVDLPLVAGGRPFVVRQHGDRLIAAGGLGDLRIFTSANVEVPFLFVSPPTSAPAWIAARSLLATPRTEKTSGIEADLGDVVTVDAIRLEGMRPPYLKRFTLDGSGDRERWTTLIAQGTAFDLPAENLTQSAIAFEPGAYRYLRVTWDDTNSAPVGPPSSASARTTSTPPASPRLLRAPLVVERRPSEPGHSRFSIRLPGARLPIVALELAVDGGHLLRNARVVEARLSGQEAAPDTLGRTTLRRVVRDGVAAEALTVAIRPPQEPLVELVVDDGDNPPLGLQGVTATFAELPWIYLDTAEQGLTARYGDRNLTLPRYDLEAARHDIPASGVPRAVFGAAQALAETEEAPPLPMPDVGRGVDATTFRFARSIPAGPRGLITVPLDGAVLAHSRSVQGGFADVRVVDAAGQQVPYLLERRDGPLTMDVPIAHRDLPPELTKGQPPRTGYAIPLPYLRLPSARLAITTRARVFQRDVSLVAVIAPDERRREPRLKTLQSVTWVHANELAAAPALVLNLPEETPDELALLVDEGDNQPLPIDRGTLLLPSYAIRLYRPGPTGLDMVYGRDDLAPPRYDLALLAPQVLGHAADEVHAAAEQPHAHPSSAGAIVSPAVFWASLGLAVVVLLGMVVRLVRGEHSGVTHDTSSKDDARR